MISTNAQIAGLRDMDGMRAELSIIDIRITDARRSSRGARSAIE